ncbi:MAG: hypothetical protein HN705_16205, partial [Rhodospirillales bacterium]|nr:hypothetical protein [Rhodospirillales bacterium]
RDTLNGLKENVIVGRLIPAGTGATMNRFREVAADRDSEMEVVAAKERAKLEAAAEKAAAAAEEATPAE